jgi:hypothetical protein
MKLETSRDLLERVRARHHSSWYGLAKLLPAAENTVANWRHQRTTIDRKFVTRIAELLEEPAEYVLACVENERTSEPDVRLVWRRIAERFRSTASILLVALGLMTAHGRAAATVSDVELVGNCQVAGLYIMRNSRRRIRRLAKLLRCLKSQSPAPLHPASWARICSTALPLSRSPA